MLSLRKGRETSKVTTLIEEVEERTPYCMSRKKKRKERIPTAIRVSGWLTWKAKDYCIDTDTVNYL